jgi:type II secretory pathway component GspD/PulD (secretin)
LPSITNVERIASIKLEDGSYAEAPVTSHRETDTMARVRNGETIVIGGLMQTRRDKTATGVPILGKIPFVGGLFRGVSNTEQKDELVIFLTPTIVVGQPPVRP